MITSSTIRSEFFFFRSNVYWKINKGKTLKITDAEIKLNILFVFLPIFCQMVSTTKELILWHIKQTPGILNRRELHRLKENVSSIAFRLSPVFSCFLRCQGRKQNWFCIGEFSKYFFLSFSFFISFYFYSSCFWGEGLFFITKRIRGTQRQ